MYKKKILVVFGTRPEAIKFAPLIKALQNDSSFHTEVCVTGQHKEMLQQVLDFFDIKADYNLNLMQPNQTLYDITAQCLLKLKPVLETFKPDIVFVQGDTTTAFAGALAAFYSKIKIAHLEAGLRSGDLFSPFPEEANRKLIGSLAQFHFAPTQRAVLALHQENIIQDVWMVGNTVIDALLMGLKKLDEKQVDFKEEFNEIDFSKRIVLITAHRRESFGNPFIEICDAIANTASIRPDFEFVYPVHLNPNVTEVVYQKLAGLKNVHLIPPLDYSKLIWLMKKSYLVLTDSGGIQEEAPALGKPVLVMRDVTERVEGIEAGTAKLIGTKRNEIEVALSGLLDNLEGVYDRMSQAVNPYGDGTTSIQIINKLKERL
jgi:UDP-N-acetylglucosamine 2-epimerase (non-hydrolysing)